MRGWWQDGIPGQYAPLCVLVGALLVMITSGVLVFVAERVRRALRWWRERRDFPRVTTRRRR